MPDTPLPHPAGPYIKWFLEKVTMARGFKGKKYHIGLMTVMIAAVRLSIPGKHSLVPCSVQPSLLHTPA